MKPSTAVQKAPAAPHLRIVPADKLYDQMRETFDAVARRAFEIFETNGARFGHELDDWLRAEGELLHPVHLDVSEADDAVTVRAEVPGFGPDDVEISVEPRRITISGKRESTEEKHKGKHVYSEHCSDRILRVADLPAEVDVSKADSKATYDRGVLTIVLPKAAAVKPQKIKVEPKQG